MISCGWCATSIRAPEDTDEDDDMEKLPDLIIKTGKQAASASAQVSNSVQVGQSQDSQMSAASPPTGLLNRDSAQ